LQTEEFLKTLSTTYSFRWQRHSILEFTGKDTVDLLHRLSTNDLLASTPDETVGTCFLTEKGRIIDVAYVLRQDDRVLALTSPGAAEESVRWIERFIIMEDVTVRDCSDTLQVYSVIGPASGEAIERLFGVQLSPWNQTRVSTVDSTFLISRRGGREENRYDLVMPGNTEQESSPLNDFVHYSEDIKELMRIWNGLPAYPHELSSRHNPYEAGCSSFLNFQKGCYIGQEVIARLDTYDKVQNYLAGVLLPQRVEGSEAEMYRAGEVVGTLTSCSPIPIEGRYPALAILSRKCVSIGQGVSLDREGTLTGQVYALPFSGELLLSSAGVIGRGEGA
jgi:folate-binding protein YgfZ